MSSSFANSPRILESGCNDNLGNLEAVGTVNYRTRTELVDFDAGDPFVRGDRVTDLLQQLSKVPSVMDSAIRAL